MSIDADFTPGTRYDFIVEGAKKVSGVVESVNGTTIVVHDVLSGTKQAIDAKTISSFQKLDLTSRGSYNVDAHGVGSGPGWVGGEQTERTTPNYKF